MPTYILSVDELFEVVVFWQTIEGIYNEELHEEFYLLGYNAV
jgi:uncharacterized protein YktA (UPF0223 family)